MVTVRSLRTGIKYKETPIGKIPVDWEVVKLQDVVTQFYNGGTPATKVKEYWDGKLPWITGADFENKKIGRVRKYITELGVKNSATNVIPKGNLLVVTRTGVGKIAITPFDVAISQDITGIIADSQKTTPGFLYWYFNYNENKLRSAIQGTSINGILRDDLASLLIGLPPLKEQESLDDILTSIEGAIDETDKIIEKTKELKKGLMQKLLTSGIGHEKFKRTEIGKIPAEWELKSLADFISVKHGYAFEGQHFDNEGPVLLTPGNFAEDGGVYFNHRNVKKYSGEYPKEFVLSPGDLVLVMTDLSPFCKILGNPAIIPDGNTLLHNQRIGKVVFKNKKLVKEFLFYFFLSRRFKQMIKSTATGTTVRHTAPNRIANIKIALPQIAEQIKIAAALLEVDSEIKGQAVYKDNLEEIKKSLMQVLLTGKVRVGSKELGKIWKKMIKN